MQEKLLEREERKELKKEIEEQRELVKKYVKNAEEQEIGTITKNTGLTKDHFNCVVDILVKSSAVLTFHFQLRSGGHSSKFLQFARIVGEPKYLDKITKMLTYLFWDLPVDNILAPTSIGGVYGFEIARELDVPLVLAELNNDKAVLHDGFKLAENSKVLIVNDLSTTGKGIVTLNRLVQEHLAQTVGVGLFACRYSGGLEALKEELKTVDIPSKNVHSLIEIHTDYFNNPENCQLCKQHVPYVDAHLLI